MPPALIKPQDTEHGNKPSHNSGHDLQSESRSWIDIVFQQPPDTYQSELLMSIPLTRRSLRELLRMKSPQNKEISSLHFILGQIKTAIPDLLTMPSELTYRAAAVVLGCVRYMM